MPASFYKNALLAAVLLGWCQAEAQSPPHFCGTTHEDQYLIRERMFRNRELRHELLPLIRSRNDLFYIPIQFHLVSSNGSNHHPITEVYNVLCRINEDLAYLNMNYRFVMNGPVNFIQNPALYNHAQTSSDELAQFLMQVYKVQGVGNIFVGRNGQSGDSFGAYYTRGGDVIYTFKDDVNYNSSALTHELGHFFTLPHTFFGWENTSYASEVIDGRAPGMVGGVMVEKVRRPGQGGSENCQWAADGFCDTPADYTTGWFNCNFTGTMISPDSLPIDPQESNMMSYFPRMCMDTFTLDQQEAMLLDIYSRGYDRFPAPASLAVTGAPTLTWPRADAPALYPGLIELRWEPAAGATRYLVTVQRLFNGNPIETTARFETGYTTAWVNVQDNQSYRWTVRPLTDLDVCNNFSAFENFQTLDWQVGTQPEQEQVAGWRVFPNPQRVGQELHIEIESKTSGQARLTLYNAIGEQVMRPQTLDLVPGAHLQHLPTDILRPGLYILTLETAQGHFSQKITLEE